MGERYRINQLRAELGQDLDKLAELVARSLQVNPVDLGRCVIRRKALDARGKAQPFFSLNVEFEWLGKPAEMDQKIMGRQDLSRALPLQREAITPGEQRLKHPPIVVGAGPAGLTAALTLAEAGYAPLILERGDGLRERIDAVERFWQEGVLDPESNIQYGAGGAGTFSDGKLVTRIKDPAAFDVLEILTGLGAPDEIRYEAKPHVGTDRLRTIVAAWEERIRSAGGVFYYHTRVKGPIIREGRCVGVRLENGGEIPAEVVILAIGNSGREIYGDLHKQDVLLEAKPIAIGLRVEHPQALIDKAQYGRWAGDPRLGAADYKLTYHDGPGNRGVYSFCMCPGGVVVAAASEPNGVVTNGMSYYDRDSGIANAAIVATVYPEEYGAGGPLAGVAFQRFWEQKAFELGGQNFYAPSQSVQEFLGVKRQRTKGSVQPTYRPGVAAVNLHDSLPSWIAEPIARALKRFDGMIPGFVAEGVLTGVETRTSAPVRIVRDARLLSPSAEGLYPCGEGSGYAGGIVSAAVDGLRTARAIVGEYRPEIKN